MTNSKIIPAPILDNDSINIGIESMSITYTQNPDDASDPDDYQFLTIEAVPSVYGEKEFIQTHELGYYLRIKTEKWAIDEVEDIMKVVNDFKQRLLLFNENKND